MQAIQKSTANLFFVLLNLDLISIKTWTLTPDYMLLKKHCKMDGPLCTAVYAW